MTSAAKRLSPAVIFLSIAASVAAVVPLVVRSGPGPEQFRSIRGVEVVTHGFGPYRHMPADVAVQGFAQDLVTLFVAAPFLLIVLAWARRGSRAGHLALTGGVAYIFVQYVLYLAMATYNELFLLWVALVGVSFQVLVRLLLAKLPAPPDASATVRRGVGGFLILNGVLISLLWLGVIVPPLLDGTLYPRSLAHFTTLIVQGFDLALFIPPSILAGYAYARRRAGGDRLAPVYAVFLSLQMTALLAKIAWMAAIGVSAGPALVVIPLLLVGAMVSAVAALRASSDEHPGLPLWPSHA